MRTRCLPLPPIPRRDTITVDMPDSRPIQMPVTVGGSRVSRFVFFSSFIPMRFQTNKIARGKKLFGKSSFPRTPIRKNF